MRLLFTSVLALVLFCSQGVHGAAVFAITEVYSGITGEDGTDDWFEISNLGDAAGDTGNLFYDDNSANPTSSDRLSSITLSPGQAAVFLISNSFGQDAAQYRRVWGPDSILGSVDGAYGARSSSSPLKTAGPKHGSITSTLGAQYAGLRNHNMFR